MFSYFRGALKQLECRDLYRVSTVECLESISEIKEVRAQLGRDIEMQRMYYRNCKMRKKLRNHPERWQVARRLAIWVSPSHPDFSPTVLQPSTHQRKSVMAPLQFRLWIRTFHRERLWFLRSPSAATSSTERMWQSALPKFCGRGSNICELCTYVAHTGANHSTASLQWAWSNRDLYRTPRSVSQPPDPDVVKTPADKRFQPKPHLLSFTPDWSWKTWRRSSMQSDTYSSVPLRAPFL